MQIERIEQSSKKSKKTALGKGLSALIPDIESMDENSKEYFQCDINLIRPNRYQPRQQFLEEELKELSDSIREQGIIQPIVVRNADTGYEIIAGERRFRAAKMAGLSQVPVIVKNIPDAGLLMLSLIENIQRQDLNPVEEADAYHFLMTEFRMTQDDVAKSVGKSRSAVANFLRIRQLPEEIKDSIIKGIIRLGHAKVILSLDTPERQIAAWKIIVEKNLSVRESEALVKRFNTPNEKPEKPEKPEATSDDIYFSSLEDDLSRYFGTRVYIKRKGKKGKLEIEFYSDDDLNRLFEILKGIREL